MLFKSKIKYIQSLSLKKQRDEDGVFVAEGPKIINELLADGTAEALEIYAMADIIGSLSADPAKVIEIDYRTLQQLSFLSTPNQVIGVFKKPVPGPLNLDGTKTLMLDGIQDPGNLGSIVRCADWFGIRQLVFSVDCADAFGQKAVQSTMASIARVDLFYENLQELLLSYPSVSTYATTLEGKNVYDVPALQEGVLVIGNESKGISEGVLSLCKNRITIPRKGKAESLNAAVATGIVLSHLMR